ncbi:MAG: glycosyltransferase [Rhodospirillales bacterium]
MRRGFIEACLRSLLVSVEQAGLGAAFEILVMDGGSTDETAAIVGRMSAQVPAIRLCANPGRLQSAAVNLAAEIADPRARILMRADAHALYPANFVGDCMAALRDQDASSVVVPMINRGVTPIQRAIAAAQSGRLGNGGSAHRTAGASCFVDHGHHAAFDRAVFQRLGGYDTRFTHNEDAEF